MCVRARRVCVTCSRAVWQAFRQREAYTRDALARIAGARMLPAISAAALSTGVMGFLMSNAATVLTYQLGLVILPLAVLTYLLLTTTTRCFTHGY